jgi:hypothetical protein
MSFRAIQTDTTNTSQGNSRPISNIIDDHNSLKQSTPTDNDDFLQENYLRVI